MTLQLDQNKSCFRFHVPSGNEGNKKREKNTVGMTQLKITCAVCELDVL